MKYSPYENTSVSREAEQHVAHVVTWGLVEEAGAWPLAGEILEMLDDECEVDASFFEDCWIYGLSPALQNHQRRREQSEVEPTQDCSFAELDRLSERSWMQDRVGSEKPFQAASFVSPATSYRAEWLQVFSEETNLGFTEPANARGSTVSDYAADEMRMMRPMTRESACKLLHLSAESTDAQIKAAYRRLVHQCHPDHFEGGNAVEQARANECMAAINEAYRMLRSAVSNA